ncbi:MAG: DUF1007 family protein [Cocleimonas sp.]|nr:DUF1007 family protein [Cocleimonas sp.]
MKKITLLLALWSLLFASLAYAHFHYNITATATLQANNKKQLTAVGMEWVYGQEVSGMMLKSGQSINALANGIMTDLVKLDYFTQLELNGKRIAIKQVTDYKLVKIKQGNQNLLKLSFLLPLQSPLFIQGNTLAIVHTDPGASASIFYHHTNNIILGNTFKSLCQSNIQAIKGFEAGEAPELVRISCNQ